MAKNLLSACSLIGVVVFLFGCDALESPNRYELVASAQGYVYRLDKKTGDVSIIEEDTIRKVEQSQTRDLIVGSLYKTEDGNVVQYVGKGTFGVAKRTITLKSGKTVIVEEESSGSVEPRKPGESIPDYLKELKIHLESGNDRRSYGVDWTATGQRTI